MPTKSLDWRTWAEWPSAKANVDKPNKDKPNKLLFFTDLKKP
jgi:hypothetical protein